jgi:hypothetical protein
VNATRKQRRFRPGLDRLDDRCLPAAGLRLHFGTLSPGQAAHDAEALSGRRRSATYSFHLDATAAVDASLTNVRGRVDLDLSAGGTSLAGSHNPGSADERVASKVGPGDYTLRVSRGGRKSARFSLDLTTQAVQTPANGGAANPPAAAPTGGAGAGAGAGAGVGPPPAPAPTPAPTPATGTQVYDLNVSGTAFSGTTGFLGPDTTFLPVANFNLTGVLVVTPTVQSSGLFNNGPNPLDAAIVTGSGPVGGTGSVEFATNSALHQLLGANFISAASEDDAVVSLDATRHHLVIDVDPSLARTQEFNTVCDQALDVERVITGRMTVDFNDDGTLTGSLTFYGEAGHGVPGTSEVSASFAGRRRG